MITAGRLEFFQKINKQTCPFIREVRVRAAAQVPHTAQWCIFNNYSLDKHICTSKLRPLISVLKTEITNWPWILPQLTTKNQKWHFMVKLNFVLRKICWFYELMTCFHEFSWYKSTHFLTNISQLKKKEKRL